MKEITLKEWSAYLPYELKGQLTFDKSDDFEWQDWASDLSKFEKGTIWKLCGYADPDLSIPLGEGEFNGWLWRNENTYVNFHSGIKPILRDLSDLTKEIEHNGEKFVPIDYSAFKTDKESIIEFQNKFAHFKSIKFGIIERLLEWKFNVFQIPDELIVKVTNEFNPYK